MRDPGYKDALPTKSQLKGLAMFVILTTIWLWLSLETAAWLS